MNKSYLVLDEKNNPVCSVSDHDGSVYVFPTLRGVFRYFEEELQKHDGLRIVELVEIERYGSGM